MIQSRKEKRRIAQMRVTAAWLALDGHTDLATLTKMIEVARRAQTPQAGAATADAEVITN